MDEKNKIEGALTVTQTVFSDIPGSPHSMSFSFVRAFSTVPGVLGDLKALSERQYGTVDRAQALE